MYKILIFPHYKKSPGQGCVHVFFLRKMAALYHSKMLVASCMFYFAVIDFIGLLSSLLISTHVVLG